MGFQKVFYDKYLRLYYYCANENDTDIAESGKGNEQHSDYYRLTYFKGDEINIVINGKKCFCNEPVLIVSKPKQNFQCYCKKRPFVLFRMQIHPRMFENIEESDKVLDFFYDFTDEQCILKLDQPQNSELNTCIDFIVEGLFAKCGKFSMVTRVNMLISEINLIFESHYKEYIASTNNLSVQIMDYIERHYLEDITSKTVCEKFYVSYNTMNSIVKSYVNLSFGEFVTSLRLSMASKLIESGHHSLTEIAKLSGFRSYPAFFQAYKKHYGVSPSHSTLTNHSESQE